MQEQMRAGNHTNTTINKSPPHTSAVRDALHLFE